MYREPITHWTHYFWRTIRTTNVFTVLMLFALFHGVPPVVAQPAVTPQSRDFQCVRVDCCDQHEWCRFWASIGECAANRDWMAANCQIACGHCRRPTAANAQKTSRESGEGTEGPGGEETTGIGGDAGTERDRQQCARLGTNVDAELPRLLQDQGLVVVNEDVAFRRQVSLDDVNLSNTQFGCVPQLTDTDCQRSLCYHLSYRTIDGSCNNLHRPLFGAAFTPLMRLLPPVYDNDMDAPVGSMKLNRPSAREASRFLLSSGEVIDNEKFNGMLMQWGQFISHDVAKTTLLPNTPCTSCQDVPGRCFNIQTTPADPRFGRQGCLRSARSSPVCGTGESTPRSQLNENTAYIDGSMVYGSSIADMHKFRDADTGFLRVSRFNDQVFMPFNQNQCLGPNSCTANFEAGDNRANIFIGLATLHTLLVREHNRVAFELQLLNADWDGERLFQEARKIVGAELQAITYNEYLPKILGAAAANFLGNYSGYDPAVDPSIANQFTTATFRFGHGMIQAFLPRLDANGQMIAAGGLPLSQGVFRSNTLLFDGGLDPVLRGLMTTPAKRPQRLGPAVTENLFGGLDLAALNIQRGRDHGLPGYTAWRGFCGLGNATTFDDLSAEMLDEKVRDNVRQGYREPEGVDLFVGAMLEDPVVDGMVGTTLSCLIGDQFKRLREGDRFYYENPGVFTTEQRDELRRSSLAALICANGDGMRLVPKDAFHLAVGANLIPCADVAALNLTKWLQ